MALNPLTNYPNGFSGGVNILGMPVLNTYGGNVYWVNSNTGTNNNRGTRDRPLPTIDAATTLCTANNGDIVMVMENHAETITGAGGITFDKAGVTYVGLGKYNNRPRFLMDGGTGVTAVVSAADVCVENMVFAGGHNGITSCFDIDAVGFCAKGLEFEDNDTDEHFLVPFLVGSTTDNTCDGLIIEGCKWVTEDSGATIFVSVVGDLDNATIVGNTYIADAATAAQLVSQAAGDDMNGLVLMHNYVVSGATTDIGTLITNNQSDNGGIIAHNLIGSHDNGGANPIVCVGCRLFENYHVPEDGTQGLLLPAAADNTG